MRTRLTALLAAALFWAGCASTPAPPPPPPGPPPPPPPRALSPQAAAFFARAEAPGPGVALVVDLDALESLGLLGKGQALRQLAGLAGGSLPELVTEAGDEKDAALVARSAVAASVLRHWAEWPSARRFGVVVSQDVFQGASSQRPPWARGVVALAVEEGSPDTAKLLVGLAALGHSVTEELSREGAEVRLSLQGTDLCMEGAELEVPVCLRPRPGLLLLGAPSALEEVEAATRTAAPAVTAATEGAATVAAPAPLLVGLRVDLGQEGRASLAFTGRDAVRLAVRVEGVKPQAVGSIDRMVEKFLRDYDARDVEKRERIGRALTEVQGALAQDATAPAELKEAARTLTVQQVVDEKGYRAAMRQSVQVEKAAQDAYAVSLTVPEGLVRDIAELVRGGGALTVTTVGALAAVAIPNFIKFQSRAKQSEVKANLKAAYTGQRMYASEKNRWGKTFRDIGFAPEAGRRYTYCMGTECLPCDSEGCAVAPVPPPCKGIAKVGKRLPDGFTVCAYGNVDNDEELDVWVIDQDGVPQQLNADER